jgi:hypothetical protein
MFLLEKKLSTMLHNRMAIPVSVASPTAWNAKIPAKEAAITDLAARFALQLQ